MRPRHRRLHRLPDRGLGADPRRACRRRAGRRLLGPAAAAATRASPHGGSCAEIAHDDATDDIGLEVADHVATITIDRPAKLNAVTPAMTDALSTACRRGERRPTTSARRADRRGRALVLRRLRHRRARQLRDAVGVPRPPRLLRRGARAAQAGRSARSTATPSAAGSRLALSAATSASPPTTRRFAAPEIKLGWIGGGGMTYLLAHSIGASNAAQMILTGDPIDARAALRWGLVSEVVAGARTCSPARASSPRPSPAGRRSRRETAKANLRAAYEMGREDGDPLRARPADHLLRDRGRRRGPRGLQGAAPGRVPRGVAERPDPPRSRSRPSAGATLRENLRLRVVARALRAIAVSSCVNSG